MNKINTILKQVLEKVEPPKEDIKLIEDSLKSFIDKLQGKIKKQKIGAEVFVGGSFAKKTVVKKNKYDADVFLRFDKKYDNKEISRLTEKLMKGFKNVSIIHGSRDYFQIKISPDFFIELVPVLKVSHPKESENITDLSYSHVNYIKRKVKSQKVLDEIKLAKSFCHAVGCYGAESYINGFSGYALELLVHHYQSFEKLLKELVKVKDKAVIDIEKHHKNKQSVLMDLNSAKLESPIILIDPTYKDRNALAALSADTLKKFQKAGKSFLKSPSLKSFEVKKTDLEKIKRDALGKKDEFILLEAKTNKPAGDVAGSKLMKFYNHLAGEVEKQFVIIKKGFNYNEKNAARFFLVVRSKKELVFIGPSVKQKENVKLFKKKHKRTSVKAGRVIAREKIVGGINKFISRWTEDNKRKIKEMSIKSLKII